MPPRLADPQRWKFSTEVVVPVVMAVLITAMVVAGFMMWSVINIDERSLERQTRLMSRAVAEQVARLRADQDSVTVWDEAVMKAGLSPYDTDWLNFNFGGWLNEFYGHDGSLLLDAKDKPIFAMRKGVIVPVESFAVTGNLAELVSRLRATLHERPSDWTAVEHAASRPRVSDFIQIDGTPAIVSISPIVSDSGRLWQVPGTESLHVAIVDLDQRLADRIGEQYLFQAPRFTTLDQPSAGRALFPINSSTGRLVSFVEWEQDRPGVALLQRMTPALIAGFVVGSLLLFLLTRRLWRSSQDLARGRSEAQHQATHDGLTGLPNRALFDERVTTLLADPREGSDLAAVMMLDLDRFKQVNDALGHAAGDQLIQAVAQRLSTLLGPHDLIARLGGDEFAVVHVTQAGQAEALALANRIIEAISKPFDLNGFEAFVGVSIGIAMIGHDGTDRAEMARRADIALYEAKARGRDRAVVYETRMGEQLQNRHQLEAELREALRSPGQLSVAFQPLFGTDRSVVTGCEALMRWTHPILGQVSPAIFIPVAETSGLIEALGMMVMRDAMRLGARWPGRTIAVNISPAQLRTQRFATDVLAMLAETGMRAEDLELEITEGTLLADEPVTQHGLRMLRDAGIRIALDDFGTGYSSLSYLRRYDVDRIKIDRSFTAQLAEGNVSVAIVQAMITLAHAMGIEVTAEGVETEGQFEALQQMGCNTFQGYLLSAPITPELMESMFRTLRPRRRIEGEQPGSHRPESLRGDARVA